MDGDKPLAWIESHTVLMRHRKVARVAIALRLRRSYVIGHLHSLWHAALEQQDDGDLSSWSDEFIAECSDFPGDAPQWVRLLQETGWLDDKLLHDWPDYAGAFLRNRYASGNRDRLVEIWAKHGRVYGEPKPQVNKKEATSKKPPPTIPNQPNQPTQKEPAAYRQFTDYFCQRWKEVHEETYPFEGQGPIAAKIWKSLKENLSLAKRVIDAYLAETTDFYAGHKLGKLQSDLARFMAKTNKNGAHPSTGTPLEKARRFE